MKLPSDEEIREFWEEGVSDLIKKGDYPVKIVFLDSMAESIRVILHFENKRTYRCAGNGCPICAQGNSPSKVFYLEVYDIEQGRNRILNGGKKLALALLDWEAEIKEEGEENGLKGKAFKISRLGDDRNPTWQIKPVVFTKKVQKVFDMEEEVNKLVRSPEEYQIETSIAKDVIDEEFDV